MYYKNLLLSSFIALLISYTPCILTMEITTKNTNITPPNLQLLITATKAGDLEQIKELATQKKINPSICGAFDAKEMTPLMHAVKNGKMDVVKYFTTDMRVNVNAQSKQDGFTALMWGAARNFPEIVKYLIEEKHAQINATTNTGETSFQIANICGSTSVVKYFVEQNNFNKKINGAIALNLAHRNKCNDTIQYLEQEIGALPKPGDLAGVKTIFYHEQANKYLNPQTLEVLAYFDEPIIVASDIIPQNDLIMHVYQFNVMKQIHAKECAKIQLGQLVEKWGDTAEQHYKANPIFGGTCSYHALKNALIGLMVLYDYDKLIDACNNANSTQCTQIADLLNTDLEKLQQLIPNDFVEHFMESLHAKTLMLKSPHAYGPEQDLINTKAALGNEKQHITKHTFDNTLGSVMSQRYQLPLDEFDNSLSYCNVYGINHVARHGFKTNFSIDSWWDKSDIPTQEHELTNCETLYQNSTKSFLFSHRTNCLSTELQRIGAFDLLQQIALFRTNTNYRHAFVISLNTASSDGYDTSSDAMHAVTVILDKRKSTVNVIVLESNNATEWAFKDLIFNFLSLFTDEKKYPMNKAYNAYLAECASHKSGICIKSPQKGLPSFESLVNAYAHIKEKCINEKKQEDATYALFMLGEIEHHYNRAQLRAEYGTDKDTFDAVKTTLIKNKLNPEDLSHTATGAPSNAEIDLHNLIHKIDDQELIEKMHGLLMNSASKESDILPKIKQLLTMGVNPNTCYMQLTPLMRSFRFPNIITYLIEEGGADIEISNQKGTTPLMAAAEWGHFDVVKDLLKQRGAKINKQDNNGYTELIYAAKGYDNNKKLEIITFLIDNGADFTLCDNNNCTLLIHSATSGAIDVIKYLVTEKRMSLDLKEVISYLIKEHRIYNIQLIDYFIKEHNLNIKNNPNLVLEICMATLKRGSTNIILRLLENDCGMNINIQDSNGWTILMHAVEIGYHLLVKDLIAIEGIDLQIKNNDGATALDIAYAKKFNSAIEMLGGTPEPWQPTKSRNPFFSNRLNSKQNSDDDLI